MKKHFCIAFLVMLHAFIYAEIPIEMPSYGSARIVPPGEIEFGLARSVTYGIYPRFDISSWLLWSPFVPNIEGSIGWQSFGPILFSTTHAIYSPTPLLRFLSREGTGGIIPPDNKVPLFIGFDNYATFTYPYVQHHEMTVRVGGKLCGTIGEKLLETIDYFMAYPRTAALYSGYSFVNRISFYGLLYNHFDYWCYSDLFILPEMEGTWEFEQTALLVWRIGRLTLNGGCRFVVGSFPFGTDWQLFPQFDIQYRLGKKR